MASTSPRGSGIFSGLVLLTVGVLLLLHNYRGFELSYVFTRWWPLLLIVWGAIKLYERSVISRSSGVGAARITAGEVFLVLGMLALIGTVVAVDIIKTKAPWMDINVDGWGRNTFSFDVDVPPKTVAPDAHIVIRGGRGDITVRASNTPEVRVSGKKNVHGWNEAAAERLAGSVSVAIEKNGDAYEIQPAGFDASESRIRVDMEVVVPAKAFVTVRSEKKGDITVSDLGSPVAVSTNNGDVEVRDTAGDVSVDMRHGDVKVSDTKGNVKISGNGGEVAVVTASGGLTLDGEFYGPIRAEKIAKGVRFISQRTDLTLTQLSGHMEAGSGNLEIFDAPGNLTLRTNSYDVTIENATGKMKVDNRDGNIELRFSNPPKEDMQISNSSASISLSLPGSSSFEIIADCHSGDIDSEFSADSLKKTTTGSGDTHLEGKYGSGRGPKITLRTSYGSISIRKTT